MADMATPVAHSGLEGKGGGSRWLPWLLYGLTALIFLPVTQWLLTQTWEQQQLRHAFIILGFAGAILVYHHRLKLRPVWQFDNLHLYLLMGAFGLFGLSGLFLKAEPEALKLLGMLAMMTSYLLALASALLFAFGRRVGRFLRAMLGAFALFMLMVLLMPWMDWPLRALAGQGSQEVLGWIGRSAELGLSQATGEPVLYLVTNGIPFQVAAECNGFGVMTAALLLTMLLVIYKRVRLFDKGLLLVAAVVLSFIFNTLRIVVIVQLAPHMMDHYFLMHEIVGSIAYYGCLGAIWWLIEGFGERTPPATEAVPAPQAARA